MATDPMGSPSLDPAVWMEDGCRPVEDTHLDRDDTAWTGEESPYEAWHDVIPPPCVTTGQGMEDDHIVFVLPPLCTDTSDPAGGSATEPVINVQGEANTVTEAKENPWGLDGDHAEQAATCTPVLDKATVSQDSTADVNSAQSMDIQLLHEDTGSVSPTESDGWKIVGASSPDMPYPNKDVNFPNETDSTPSPPTMESDPELYLDNNSDTTYQANVGTLVHPGECSSDVDNTVDDMPLDYDTTREQWIRRDSASSEGQRVLSREQITVPWPQSSASEQEDVDSTTVARDIQQGEHLLHRLSIVQLRQDELQGLEEPPLTLLAMGTANQVAGFQEERIQCRREEEEERGNEVQLHTVLVEYKAISGEQGTQVPASMGDETQSCPVAQPVVGSELEFSDDEQSDSGVSADFPPVTPHDIYTTPAPITEHEAPPPQKETRPADARGKGLQRSVDIANTQECKEVLDIPLMKTTLLAKTQSSESGPVQATDWQFSKKKMQQEITLEIQRELVLVNMGKIPGVYSKGTVRQMKERKLLFEAFQQGTTEGASRPSRPPTKAGMRGQVFPSVLERTRSLELVSLKGTLLSRTHSQQMFDLKAQMEKGPGQTPSPDSHQAGKGAERHVVIVESDDTGIAQFPNQDTGAKRLSRSLECLSIGGAAFRNEESTDEGTGEGQGDEGSATVRENPFFKLRPLLSMKPQVEKDIREAKEREAELRRQRCSLYGGGGAGGARPDSTDELRPDAPTTFTPSPACSVTTSVDGRTSKGKLDRPWPPPNPTCAKETPTAAQEAKVYKAGGQKSPLCQRWEAGMVNWQQPQK